MRDVDDYGLNPPDQVHVELLGICGAAAGHNYNSGYWYWMPNVHQ
jgi:hypothetical protein